MSLGELMPNEMIEIVFDYLDSNEPLSKKFLCKRRETKLNNTLRNYMKAFMPTTVYCANSIRYYRRLNNKDDKDPCGGFIRRHNVGLRTFPLTEFEYRRIKAVRNKVSKQQCCAKTSSGRRCKKKTFLLFCEWHTNGKPYWM